MSDERVKAGIQVTPLTDPSNNARALKGSWHPVAQDLCRANEHIEGIIHWQLRVAFAWWRACVRAALGV